MTKYRVDAGLVIGKSFHSFNPNIPGLQLGGVVFSLR